MRRRIAARAIQLSQMTDVRARLVLVALVAGCGATTLHVPADEDSGTRAERDAGARPDGPNAMSSADGPAASDAVDRSVCGQPGSSCCPGNSCADNGCCVYNLCYAENA